MNKTDRKHELMEWFENRRRFAEWNVAQRNDSDEKTKMAELAAVLAPIFLYLADGYRNGAQYASMHTRAFALLYVLRPDLIGDDGIDAAAVRLRTNPNQVIKAIDKLFCAVPGLKMTGDRRYANRLHARVKAQVGYCFWREKQREGRSALCSAEASV